MAIRSKTIFNFRFEIPRRRKAAHSEQVFDLRIQSFVRAHCSASLSPHLLRRYSLAVLFILLTVSACTSAPAATETQTIEPATETVAATSSPVPITTIGISPTLVPVAGTANVANASCRVGPGGGYLVRQVIHNGDAVEILGQMDLNANWILVRVTESLANCWINSGLVDHPADSVLNTINDPHIVLPYTTYYSPLRGVIATRNGDVVRVRWDPLVLREADQIEETPYILAAWVCQNGNFVFRSAGTDEYAVFIRDEPGCNQSSHGLVMGAEKHGYTQPVVVDWP